MYTNLLVQASDRHARAKFRKLWKNLRCFGGAWTHPELKFQNDTLFNKTLFSYERYEPSPFYTYRVCQHLSKYRIRYLLTPRLIEPSQKNSQEEPKLPERLDIALHKALIYFSENKLLIGKRVLWWLLANNNQNLNKPYEGVDIMMSFKKVRLIKTLTVRHGYLGMINDKLVFIYAHHLEPESHLAITQYLLRDDKALAKTWPLEFVK